MERIGIDVLGHLGVHIATHGKLLCAGLAEMCKFLEPVARTANGEALVIEQVADAAHHQHFMVLVVATIAAALHGAQLRELLFPVAQDVRLDPAQLCHLADGEVTLGRYGGSTVLMNNLYQRRKSYQAYSSENIPIVIGEAFSLNRSGIFLVH